VIWTTLVSYRLEIPREESHYITDWTLKKRNGCTLQVLVVVPDGPYGLKNATSLIEAQSYWIFYSWQALTNAKSLRKPRQALHILENPSADGLKPAACHAIMRTGKSVSTL
jgi:hypothetical protein